MKLSDIGEFGLIDRLIGALGAGSRDLVVGPGDDAAVWRVGEEHVIGTTDTMVEGVHFLPQAVSWSAIGWKALAVNVSDIAAMGGKPEIALVTLCAPPELAVAVVEEMYEGLRECADEYGVAIAGGDVVRSQQSVVTVAVFGRAQTRGRPLLLRRNAAKPGDAVAVTGTLGDSAGGLRRMKGHADEGDALVSIHLRPRPRVAEGQAAVQAGIVCGIDISDGLLQDLGHVCEMSGVGAAVQAEKVPMSDGLQAAFPGEALELACTGGEDYELLLVGETQKMAGLPVTLIGEIVEGGGVRLVDRESHEIRYQRTGWDAFGG